MFRRLRFLMEAEGGGGAGGAPAPAPATPAATPAPAPAAAPVAPPAPLPEDMQKLVSNPDEFKARMAKERELGHKAVLKDFGFANVDEAKAFFDLARKEAEAKKSEQQKLSEKLATLEPLAGEVKSYEELVDGLLEIEVASIPEEKKALLNELAPAGDKASDKRQRLLWIRKAKEKGLFAVQPAAPATPAAPANTRAGNGNPPAPTPPGSNQKHPRDMTREEFQKFERERLAHHLSQRA